MSTHNKDNEWYIYIRNKDTMSQSLPQPGGMTRIHSDILMKVPFTQEKWPCPYKNEIDCASLASIRTLGPVKVREFVSFMR